MAMHARAAEDVLAHDGQVGSEAFAGSPLHRDGGASFELFGTGVGASADDLPEARRSPYCAPITHMLQARARTSGAVGGAFSAVDVEGPIPEFLGFRDEAALLRKRPSGRKGVSSWQVK